jgi:hypothetical protein
MKIVEHLIVDDEITDYGDLHMDEDLHMNLHSYVATKMIKDVLVIVDMDVADVVEDLHDTVDLCVPCSPEL